MKVSRPAAQGRVRPVEPERRPHLQPRPDRGAARTPSCFSPQEYCRERNRPQLSRRAVCKPPPWVRWASRPRCDRSCMPRDRMRPRRRRSRIGFIPLTDCASVVMASVLGIDQKYRRQDRPRARRRAGPACATSSSTASSTSPMCSTDWSTACTSGMGGPKKDMAVLMT